MYQSSYLTPGKIFEIGLAKLKNSCYIKNSNGY